MPEPLFDFHVFEIQPAVKPTEDDTHVNHKQTTRLDVALKAIKRAKLEVRCRLTHAGRTREFTVGQYSQGDIDAAWAEDPPRKLHPWWGLCEFVESTTRALKKVKSKKKKTAKKKATRRRKVLAKKVA